MIFIKHLIRSTYSTYISYDFNIATKKLDPVLSPIFWNAYCFGEVL